MITIIIVATFFVLAGFATHQRRRLWRVNAEVTRLRREEIWYAGYVALLEKTIKEDQAKIKAHETNLEMLLEEVSK